MDNRELMERIDAGPAASEAAEAAGERVKFLIVRIEEKHYAFAAEQIKEIVMDTPLYFIPFVPPYVRGVINRHGEPYTVFDLNVLFEKESLEANTFLISNFDDDQIAFLVSDIIEILKVSPEEVHPITSAEDQEAYFSGAVSSRGEDTLVLNMANLLAQLEKDLETL